MSALKILENCNTNGKSPRFSERRRALFPLNPNETCSETDSDLGHMSPLKSDSSDNEDGSCHSFDLKLSPSKNLSLPPKSSCIGDYDIIGIMDDNVSDTVFTPQNRMVEFTESMSPLYLSPFVNALSHASKKTLLDTPLKGSPTNKLKTPHDSNSVSKVPKLIRKSLLDSGFEETSKRKILDESPPDNSKIAKLDPVGHSKVRTALFPDDQVTLPSKQFYSKTLDKLPILHTNYTMKPLIKSTSRRSYPTKRKNKGGINAGVRHKIRKPKQRKLSAKLVRKAITISNDPALQQYLKDMKEINNIHTHLIENKENINMIKPVTKKRACSPELLEVKKFKPTVEENSTSELDDYDTKLQETRIEIEDGFNFSSEDDDISPNIDDIITSLNANQNSPEKNSIVLQAHDSITQSQNSIQLHNPSAETSSIANILLSPTSQMCDMASGLALNSPKKVKNLTNLLEEIPVENISSAPKRRFEKLFPMFATYKTATAEKNKSVKKIKKTGQDQMLLDAGQKKFGTIQCKECDFVYLVGDSVDETIHNTYHTSTHLLKFHVSYSFVYDLSRGIPTNTNCNIKAIKTKICILKRF